MHAYPGGLSPAAINSVAAGSILLYLVGVRYIRVMKR